MLIVELEFPELVAYTINTDSSERDTQRKVKNCKEMNGNSSSQHYLKVREIDPN